MLDIDETLPRPRWRKHHRFLSECRIQKKPIALTGCKRAGFDVQPERTGFSESWHGADGLCRLGSEWHAHRRPSWTPRHWRIPVNCLLTYHICPRFLTKESNLALERSYASDDSPQNKFKRERGTRSHVSEKVSVPLGLEVTNSGRGSLPFEGVPGTDQELR